jgi:hypothetical protein
MDGYELTKEDLTELQQQRVREQEKKELRQHRK